MRRCKRLKQSQFQSTRPRRARPKALPAVLINLSFNPRARVGRDPDFQRVDADHGVSIHAPA